MGFSQTTPRLDRRAFAPGREIFAQGEPGDCAYLVESGAVGIFQYLDGRRIELATVRQGEIFGEMAAIDGGPRMAGAIAIEPTEVTRIPKETFDRKLAESDRFVRVIVNFFIRAMRGHHHAFMRRPRSAGDHLRVMDEMMAGLRAFCHHSAHAEAAEGLDRALDDLEASLRQVRLAAARCPDNRHDLVVDDEG